MGTLKYHILFIVVFLFRTEIVDNLPEAGSPSNCQSPSDTSTLADNATPSTSISNVTPKAVASKAASGASTASKKRKPDDSLQTELSKIDDQIKELSKPSETEDEAYVFAQSLIPSLRRLSIYQLAVVKQRVLQTIFDVEFQTPDYQQESPYNPTYHHFQ